MGACKVAPQVDGGILEDLLRVVAVGHQRPDGPQDLALPLDEEAHKSLGIVPRDDG
jgi:hypothetical protein